MLSIVWIIIKVIGIILLGILGMIAAGVLTVLLVPVRYGAQLSWLEKKANGTVKISWLFRIIMLSMKVTDNQISAKVLLFGHDFKANRTSKKRSASKPAAKRSAKESAGNGEKSVPMVQDAAEKEEMSRQAEPETQHLLPDPQQTPGQNPVSTGGHEAHPGLREKLGKRMEGLKRAFFRVRETIRRLWNQIKSGKMKWDQWMELYHDEANQNSIRLLKKEGLRLLRQMAPKRFHANLHVGLGEPAATGLLLGAAACLMPIYEDSICLEPEFEEMMLEGDVLVKGRVRLGTFALTAVRLWKDKNLRAFIRRMMK